MRPANAVEPGEGRHRGRRVGSGKVERPRSKFEDTRQKAQKFGARGTTLKAYKPGVQ
jgi:hypothetical protein